ncbi:MAG: outer membrane lipoprotein chaperone LolA [Burkholderiaceae bacterium]|nr:outer membrane lipoprotein chaperone LolA [Burkholderiaceae bacterium]
MKRFLLTALAATACLVCLSAHADGLASLQAFVRSAHSGRAQFTQTVTPPPKDGKPVRAKISSGSFEFQRPGKFRFDYRKPYNQIIVANGKTLWLYDADLNQVTERAQAQALGNTPAALIAAAPDLRALEADFTLESGPERDGMQWIKATPKARDGQLQSVEAGFKGGQMAVLEILDNFGQRSRLVFDSFELNTPPRSDAFGFKPPAGADVIRP